MLNLDISKLPRFADMTNEAQREALADYANDVLRADYFNSVRSNAESIKHEVDSRNIENREALTERIEQEADSSYWVIYTHAALQCLRYSANDSAYADEFGEEGIVEGGSVRFDRLAYAAYRADLIQQLGALGVDVNADDLGRETDEESEDEE